MNRSIVFVPLMLLASNCAKPARVACPDPSAVAPAAIGGAAYVRGLGSRLGHGDEQNVIAEAVAEIHRMDPTMDSDAITNVLIAADCPLAAAPPDHDETADRHRIAGFRAQVNQILAE